MKQYKILSTFEINNQTMQSTIKVEANNLDKAIQISEERIKKDFKEVKNINSKPCPLNCGVVIR